MYLISTYPCPRNPFFYRTYIWLRLNSIGVIYTLQNLTVWRTIEPLCKASVRLAHRLTCRRPSIA